MYTRSLALPEQSFFVLGPRATGKSTWLREQLPEALVLDLLDSRLRHDLLREPGRFRSLMEAHDPARWVVVDEVQQVPGILNDVHALIESRDMRFALSGSSARKLKGGQANLLAGRAVRRTLHPLTFAEVGEPRRVREFVDWGALPMVVTAASASSRADILEAYSLTYLDQEIRAEALVRNLGGFSRFLEVAALANAQVTNVSAIARDAGVGRSTVQGYFEILKDTLVGHELQAWRPKARIKEQQHPKFYWFDSGVARAMAGRVRLPVESDERGRLLETYLFHELRAHIDYQRLGARLFYWRTPSGTEVDFVASAGDRHVAIEVKASERWRPEYGDGIAALGENVPLAGRFGVYLGADPLVVGGIRVLPLLQFLEALAAGKVV